MLKKFLIVSLVISISALMIGCQAHRPAVKYPPFQPADLNSKWKSGEYQQRVDNFVVVLDVSRSSGDSDAGHTNFDIARNFLYRMNQTLPDMTLNSAIRSFGHYRLFSDDQTMLNYGPTKWIRADFQAALAEVPWGAGGSPVGQALDYASDDMGSMSGPTAVILVGDGEYAGKDGASAAQRMKTRYGDNVCIYSVLVGSETPENVAMMREIADAGQCGFVQNAGSLESPQEMAAWVEKVFLEKARVAAPLDSDGDGVFDNMDQCPETPNGVAVDSTGCPLDSDRDGVPDYLDQCPDTPEGDSVDKKGCTLEKDADRDGVADADDQCPDTPLGAPVNNSGCWIIANIEFDFNSAVIKSEYYKTLNEIADVMQKNPQMTLKAEGHTCNIGAEAYNRGLSDRRAEAAKQYLIERGISERRISIDGFGFSKPAANNDTQWGRERNRRDEFKWSR